MGNKPLIKLFKTREKFYFFDTNKNTIVDITSKQYQAIEKYIDSNSESSIALEAINNMREEGYLSSNRVKEIVSSVDEVFQFYLENNVEMIILQVTQQCNFRCEYCIYSGSYYNRTHSSKRMDFETAKRAIDFLIRHSKNHDRIGINFYGGEPLIEFDLVKKCIEYAEEKCEGKIVQFYMTTNGYLLNDEVVEFLFKHHVHITISLDGPKEIHDGHRKLAFNDGGTFDKVYENIVNIQKNFNNYMFFISFNTVIDTKNNFFTIDEFFKNNEVIRNLDSRITSISESGSKKPLKVSDTFYINREYEVFREMYYLVRKHTNKSRSKITKNACDSITGLHERLKPENRLPEKSHPRGSCIVGSKRLFISADGMFYPCEKCNEASDLLRIGDLDNGFDTEQVRKLINIGKISEDECKNCWAINHCTICPAVLNSSDNEFTTEAKMEMCKKVRMEVEENLKNYCVLKEFGYAFKSAEENMNLISN
ncbi:Cys-rich peptide radical SAM maturase CcpM [Ruminiclostridium josui]|uniref:Cys-rich peptide radical SAM maturase CcpM n=1 Tax=Ruminiclostridium josui TaxID=1499 RepID=UPI0004660426|nr:Cys-rich peptide radical SAM maturase CcpM [Ruminiclostridium josui]